ncbi:MAG: DUF5719 family protein [Candidatus Geothermincolia bacterium]
MRHKKISAAVVWVVSLAFLAVILLPVAAVAADEAGGGYWVKCDEAPRSIQRAAAGENDTWYLAEGCTDYGFDTLIILENPNTTAIDVATTFMTDKGPIAIPEDSIPAESTYSLDPRAAVGAANFSVMIESLGGQPIAVERWMTWTDASGDWSEGHASIGVTAPSKIWYLAEGSSKWGFECWVLVQNPNTTAAAVELTYMIEGVGPKTVGKSVPANSRRSFFMADDIGFADASVRVSGNVPVIAERAMYRNGKREGHGSIGTVAPANDYYLAEGTTGWGFTTYVLIQNPDPSPNQVTVTYMTEQGPVSDPTFTMPANSRKTIRVNDAHPGKDLSTRVHGTKPLIAERAMYWDSGYGEVCHDSVGLSAPHKYFYLPGGISQEYIPEAQQPDVETWTLVQNPNNKPVDVRLTYLDLGDSQVVVIPANSRRTFNMVEDVGYTECGIVLECLTSGCGIMVEKSNYVMQRTMGMETIGAYMDTPPALPAEAAPSGGGRARLFSSFFTKFNPKF